MSTGQGDVSRERQRCGESDRERGDSLGTLSTVCWYNCSRSLLVTVTLLTTPDSHVRAPHTDARTGKHSTQLGFSAAGASGSQRGSWEVSPAAKGAQLYSNPPRVISRPTFSSLFDT